MLLYPIFVQLSDPQLYYYKKLALVIAGRRD